MPTDTALVIAKYSEVCYDHESIVQKVYSFHTAREKKGDNNNQ